MATHTFHLDSCGSVWRGMWRTFTGPRSSQQCVHLRRAWLQLRFGLPGVRVDGRRYCVSQCLEPALSEKLEQTTFAYPAPAAHRVPLGLFLLSRDQLTRDQLQSALAAQRNAGHGRIGEWLQALGFVTEQQVTTALARQWSCPVLRPTALPDQRGMPAIPLRLLESFAMVPVAHVEATRTLHIAFAERIDYTLLYAIEQMLDYHTEPCLAVPSFVRAQLDALSRHRSENEIAFEPMPGHANFTRILRSYCTRLAASELRVVLCGPHLWARFMRQSQTSVDLVLLAPETRSAFSPALLSSARAL